MSRLGNILRELDDEVWSIHQETLKTLERQIVLEESLYTLLKNSKTTKEQYESVFRHLGTIEKHLRNPALYEQTKKRAGKS